MGKELENHFVNLRLYLILNQFRNGFDVSFGSKLAQVCNRHFYYSYDFAGNISFDTKVSEAILANEIFIQKYPYTKTAQDLKRIVKRVFYQVSKHSNSISKAS